MDSLVYSRSCDGIRDEVFTRFYRMTLEATGELIIEYGAAHIDDRSPLLRDVPKGSVCLDGGDGEARPTPLILRADPRDAEKAALIAAIRSMRPADVSHMQRHDAGCGTAVIAHLTGATYDETARRLFPRSCTPRKIGTLRVAKETGTERRISAARTWEEAKDANACAALIRNRRGNQHYISIDPGMVIVDPEMVLPYPLDEYPRRDWRPVAYFVRATS